MTDKKENILEALDATIANRRQSIATGDIDQLSYVAKLMRKGDDAILKKIGEETTEVVMAAKDSRANSTNGVFDAHYQSKLVGEVADLWFHSLVLLGHMGLSSQSVLEELQRREGTSGIVEKNARKPE